MDLEGPSMGKSLGHMLRSKGQVEAPVPGSKAKFAAIGPGAYVAYKAPSPENPKSIVVGRVIENNTAEALMKLKRFVGKWGQTRVRWSASDELDVVRYVAMRRAAYWRILCGTGLPLSSKCSCHRVRIGSHGGDNPSGNSKVV